MSLAWLVWVGDENLITRCRWWMCGWPVAMHRAWFHWSFHCWIDGLSGICCEGIVLTNRAKRKELLNINLICFQGAGSWRGQWAERLHADLRHRLPPGGSLLWLFSCLSLSAELMCRCGRQGGHCLKGDKTLWSRESDLRRLDSMWSLLLSGGGVDNLRSLVLQPMCQECCDHYFLNHGEFSGSVLNRNVGIKSHDWGSFLCTTDTQEWSSPTVLFYVNGHLLKMQIILIWKWFKQIQQSTTFENSIYYRTDFFFPKPAINMKDSWHIIFTVASQWHDLCAQFHSGMC